jgi:putative protease
MPMPPQAAPELLAPAGDWESLRAAVANGADAVYFGLARHSARQRAANFAVEELPEVIAYLHARNVRGYVALNTLIFSDELPEAARFAAAIAHSGADAAIIQDLGLARLVHRMAPTLPLHASTQMTLTDVRGIEAARQLGVSRVIMARELSLDDLRRVRAATDMPLEVFVHGALCISYSGQCLASEFLWGRSANRGMCGQFCRLPQVLRARGQPVGDRDRPYILSPKDLAAADRVTDLVRLGIAGLKIEGRLKSAHYVAVATRTYREAIDAAVAGRPFRLTDERRRELEQSFSRGFTHGFLDGHDHRSLVHGLSPKSRGVRVGTVVAVTPRVVVVTPDTPDAPGAASSLAPGDGVVFEQESSDAAPQGGRVYSVTPAGRGRLTLTFGRNDVDLDAIAVGAVVWKTDDPRRRRDVEKSYAADAPFRRAPLAVRVEGREGGPLRVIAIDPDGRRAEAEWPGPLERAVKRPLTVDLVREQVGRMGDTPFELGLVDLAVTDPVMTPKSVLNDLRRQVVAALTEARTAACIHAVVEPDALEAMREEIRAARNPSPDAGPPVLHVLVRRPEQLDAALAWSPAEGRVQAGTVTPDFRDPPDAALLDRVRHAGRTAGLASPRIVMPGEDALLEAVAAAAPDAVLVRNLAAATFFRDRLPKAARVGDFSLNAANELTAEALAGAGLGRVTASLDLSAAQLAAMLPRWRPEALEVIAHLHVPMMHMQHCLFAAHLADASDREKCGQACRRNDVTLRGRVGAEHPLEGGPGCRSTLFSGKVQSALTLLGDMRSRGVRHFRLEFVRESADAVRRTLDLYAAVLAGALDADSAWADLAGLCPAGLVRGTWDFE